MPPAVPYFCLNLSLAKFNGFVLLAYILEHLARIFVHLISHILFTLLTYLFATLKIILALHTYKVYMVSKHVPAISYILVF